MRLESHLFDRQDAKMIKVGALEIGAGKRFLLIAGPCVIESWDVLFDTARQLKEISDQLSLSFVFKSSFDKANRTSLHSYRGPGLTKGLEMLAEIKKLLQVELLSDVHEEAQCQQASKVLDVLQIPAFLCRQTDLIVAAARTGKAVNIKKGQFAAPQDMYHSLQKVTQVGNGNVFLTERGTTFGYNNLVVDFRAIPAMQAFGYPVIFDATHSVQIPGGGQVSGGERQYVPTLAKAAVAAGCDGLFLEVHPDPSVAQSDGATQLPLAQVKELISQCLRIHACINRSTAE